MGMPDDLMVLQIARDALEVEPAQRLEFIAQRCGTQMQLRERVM